MKKCLLFIALGLLILFTACEKEVGEPLPPVDADLTEEATETEDVTPEEPEEPIPEEPEEELVDITQKASSIWQRVDGSTATLPLTEGLYVHLEGTYEGLHDNVKHHKTHNAYENLVAGECDVIFVTYPSEDEQALLDSAEHEYEIIPVVLDAFVFLVNKENPVTGLSLDQLRGIYTGEITNWKTLGGSDADIFPYQRPENSGSQTLFLELVMGDTEPIKPIKEYSYTEMSDLVDAVSAYENGKNSIGYSVYYYASQMYGNENVRILAIDGVGPTHESIISGEYTLTTCYYAVLRKDLDSESEARKLVDYILSDKGQIVAKRQMYVPLRIIDDGLGLTEEEFQRRRVSGGTGGTEYIGGNPPEDVKLSDLFYDGVNYIRYINDFLLQQITFEDTFSDESDVPFTGIDRDTDQFDITSGLFDENSQLVITDYGAGYHEIPIPADMTPYDMSSHSYNWYSSSGIRARSVESDYGAYYYVPVFESADKLNAEIEAMMRRELSDLTPENSQEIYMETGYLWVSCKAKREDGSILGFCVDRTEEKIVSGEEFLANIIAGFDEEQTFYNGENGYQRLSDIEGGQQLVNDFKNNPLKYLYMFGISGETVDWDDLETREALADEFVKKLKKGYTFGSMWHDWDYYYLEIITYDGEVTRLSVSPYFLPESLAGLLDAEA